MANSFLEQIKNRRSIYTLGRNISHDPDQLVTLILEVVKQCPSSFNSQSSRAVVLLGDHHLKLWEITKSVLQKIVDPEAFKKTEAKIDGSFGAGFGSVLFYEDTSVVKEMQEQFPSYAENFPVWSEHSTGIAQFAVWTALAQEGIGASLQHYNPLIDEPVAKEWEIPADWLLRAQMPFGSIEAPAGEKTYIDDAERFRIFK